MVLRKGRPRWPRPDDARFEHAKSIEKALILALYFAVVASGGVALGAQVLSD